jgi:hypothetical protein
VNAVPVIDDICFLISFHESALPAALESITIFVIRSASVTKSEPYSNTFFRLSPPNTFAIVFPVAADVAAVAVVVVVVAVDDILYFGFALFTFEFTEPLVDAFADGIPEIG